MNVLSLFDGMSCGRVALERAGIKVDKYYASEIDRYAIQVAKKNYPDTVHVGDVTQVRGDVDHIDLLIGGSPCQGFSFAGKQLNFDDPRSKLFFEYVRVLREIRKYNPGVKFLLENVRMKKESQDVISEYLGVEPIVINSALVSAQNRVRLYWTNIEGVGQPEDKGILLKDVLEEDVDDSYYAGRKLLENYRGGNQLNPKYKSQANTIHDLNGKSMTICAGTHGYANGYVLGGAMRGRYNPDGSTSQQLEINGMEKSNALATVQKDSLCVQIGVASEINGHDILKRVYSPIGKSPTLNAHGGGNTEPKVSEDGIRWRKLTPLECERLQTLPDGYTEGVSNTQRYKMIGNGWTVDVITHILCAIKRN